MSLPSRIGEFVRSLSRIQRELAILGIAAILGFLIMPALTWLIGMVVFKTYAGGNTVFSMYGNFYKAISKGAPVFWIVAVGPYALILVARLLVFAFRGKPSEKAAEPPAQPKRRAPQMSDERRAAPPEGRRAPPPEARRPAPQPNRAPPPTAPQPTRKAPPKPGERRTPFIKSID